MPLRLKSLELQGYKTSALLGAELTFVEAVVTRVPMRRLAYPRSFAALAQVEAAIEADLKQEVRP